MKALRKLAGGPGGVELVEIPRPMPAEGQVLLEVVRAGICGTDLHILHGHFDKVRPPVTLGHEFAGRVAQVGPGVEGWRLGERVVSETVAHTCGRCLACRQGLSNLCPQRRAYGYSADGGFAEFVLVRPQGLHRLPEQVGFQEGALVEPLAVAVHAVLERARILAGESVLITGPGPIGLLALQVARHAGGRVLMLGVPGDQKRLALAQELGAEQVALEQGDEPLEAVRALAGPEGVDLALECAGAPAALGRCLQVVRRRGRVVQVGLFGRRSELAVDALTTREVTLLGAFAHHGRSWQKALRLLAERRVFLGPLISGDFPLERWQEAFRLTEQARGLKYLLHPRTT